MSGALRVELLNLKFIIFFNFREGQVGTLDNSLSHLNGVKVKEFIKLNNSGRQHLHTIPRGLNFPGLEDKLILLLFQNIILPIGHFPPVLNIHRLLVAQRDNGRVLGYAQPPKQVNLLIKRIQGFVLEHVVLLFLEIEALVHLQLVLVEDVAHVRKVAFVQDVLAVGRFDRVDHW